MRSAEQPSSVTAGGGTWPLVLAGVLALASVAGWIFLTVHIAAGDLAFAEGQRGLAEEEPALTEGIAELEAGKRDLDEGRQAYAEAENKWHLVWADRLFRGGRGFRNAEDQIAEAERDIVAGEGKLGAGQDRMDAGRLNLQRGREQLTLARRIRWAFAGSALFLTIGTAALGVRRRRTAS